VFWYAKSNTADVPWHYNKGDILQYVNVSGTVKETQDGLDRIEVIATV